MKDNNYKINLYKHNAESFERVTSAFLSGETFVGILQATGTGKTYQALELLVEHPEKKSIYIAPNNTIIEHVKSTIKELGLSLEKDFPNLTFYTYQKIASMEDDKLENMDCDLMILDEFHHIGAPIWGDKINTLINSHPNAWKFAMSAYSVRRRGTAYERDMALPNGNELFSDKIVTRYDMADAMADGTLPIPTFITAKIDISEEIEKIEKTISSYKDKELRILLENELIKIKRLLPKSGSIQELLANSLSKNGKYIYFCPPGSTNSFTDLDEEEPFEEIPTIRLLDVHTNIMKSILDSMGLKENIDYKVYKTSSYMKDSGQSEREDFYNDNTSNMRIMFNVNQYGEGVHAPNVTGIIMSRSTESDIVAFEQIGRTLCVDNIKDEYKDYSYEELVSLAKEKHIVIDDVIKKDLSEDEKKTVIIDRLISPCIIDLAGNIKFIKELEDRIKDKVEERIRSKKPVSKSALSLYHGDYTILDINNGRLNEELEVLKQRVKIDKVAEFIEMLNTGNKKILTCPCNGYYFSNGDSYTWYYFDQKKKIMNELSSNPKYQEGYEVAKLLIYYREYYHIEAKIRDFIELLNHGNKKIMSFKNTFVFPNGDSMKTFWQNHKNEIINELSSNPKYQEGYETAKRLIESKLYESSPDVVETKIKEFLNILVQGDTSVLSYKNNHTFKNGSPMSQFYTIYKERIISYINNHPEYSICLKYISEYGYYKSMDNKIKEFLEYLNDNHPEVMSQTCDKTFANGAKMAKFFSDNKERIKKELFENPIYSEYEKAKTFFREYEYRNDSYSHIREFIEMLNAGDTSILQVKNDRKFKDGLSVNFYFSKYKKRIIDLLETKEYLIGYEVAKEAIAKYRYKNELSFRIHDFIEMANSGNKDIFLKTAEVEFKNGDLTSRFWTVHRYRIIAELESSKEYETGYEVARNLINEFEIKHGDTSKKKLANTYHIPYEEVKDIPISELLAKCEYLKSMKIAPVLDSKIHEIFNMSDKNMQKKYGISLEEMINTYCLYWGR